MSKWWEELSDERLKELGDKDFKQSVKDFQSELSGRKRTEYPKGINRNINDDLVKKIKKEEETE